MDNRTLGIVNTLFSEDTPTVCDTLIVMGTPHSHASLIRKIIALRPVLQFKRVIVSGYNGEAENIVASCLSHGLQPEIFNIENRAKNTAENIALSYQLLTTAGQQHTGKIAFLAKDYALPRCRLTAKKILPADTYAEACFYGYSVFKEGMPSFIDNPQFVRKVQSEIRKVIDYSRTGWISPCSSHCNQDEAALSSILDDLQAYSYDLVPPDTSETCTIVESGSSVSQDVELTTLKLAFTSNGVTEYGVTNIVTRPDSVGVILYCPTRDRVFLVRQFRPANALRSAHSKATEIIAGYRDQNESLACAAKREAYEETTLKVEYLFPIARFFPAPTLSSEIMHLFFGIVCSNVDSIEAIHGTREHTELLSFTPTEVTDLLINNIIDNSLTMLALQKASPYFKINYNYLKNTEL